jgi:hypothetical protein
MENFVIILELKIGAIFTVIHQAVLRSLEIIIAMIYMQDFI